MASGAERVAAWRKRAKRNGLDTVTVVVPAHCRPALNELAKLMRERAEAIVEDGAVEWLLCYRDRRGRLRHHKN